MNNMDGHEMKITNPSQPPQSQPPKDQHPQKNFSLPSSRQIRYKFDNGSIQPPKTLACFEQLSKQFTKKPLNKGFQQNFIDIMLNRTFQQHLSAN